jgi:hypothetical protein
MVTDAKIEEEAGLRRREETPAWARWAEVAGLTALAILAGPVIDPADPLLMGHRLPWPALAPLAAALRYGSAHGLASGAALALAVVARSLLALPGGATAGGAETVLGWLGVAFAAGLFRDAWARRNRQLEAVSELRRIRLDGLVRAHRMLEESHQRLRRTQPGEPGSLRDALEAVRRQVQDAREAGIEAVAGRTLGLLGELAHVHAAAFHPVDAEGRPGSAIATSGGCAGAEGDALVLEAIATRAVASVRDLDAGTELLAAIPLVDVADRVHAVVAVRDISFFALHDETLRLLAVLGGAIGDALAALPMSAPDFRREVHRAARDASRHGVPAVVARVRFTAGGGDPAAAGALASRLLADRRLSDEVASLGEVEGAPALAVLLRAAGEDEVEGYRRRLMRAAAEHGCGVDVRTWALAGPGAARAEREAEAMLWPAAAGGAPTEEPADANQGAIPRPVGASRS